MIHYCVGKIPNPELDKYYSDCMALLYKKKAGSKSLSARTITRYNPIKNFAIT